jgi:hypothetical protein
MDRLARERGGELYPKSHRTTLNMETLNQTVDKLLCIVFPWSSVLCVKLGESRVWHVSSDSWSGLRSLLAYNLRRSTGLLSMALYQICLRGVIPSTPHRTPGFLIIPQLLPHDQSLPRLGPGGTRRQVH